MAITAKWYGQAFTGAFSATAARRVDWVGNTIKVALCTSTYVPNQDTDVFFAAVTNELPTAGGYTAGGAALTGKSVSYDAPSNDTRLIAAASSWSAATFTCRIAVVYDATTGVAATEPLLGWVDFGADETVASGTFTITWDATNGVMKTTPA